VIARTILALGAAALGTALALPSAAPSDPPHAGLRLTEVEVHPREVAFDRRHEYAQLLFRGRTEDGEWIDVTREARLVAQDPPVSFSERGLLLPGDDGEGRLTFEVGGLRVDLPIRVQGQSQAYEASFVRDVMPILSKAGCTSGGCHGSQDGENGFKLSLRGYDPVADHLALTDDLACRRVDRAFPERSLMLLKPTAEVPHEGGQRFARGSREYSILREWVASGAALDDAERALHIEIFPEQPTIPRPGMSQQFAVLATYADGRVRDVTADAFIETNDTEVTSVDEAGLVTALRRGEAAVLARYEGRYAGTSLFVMGDREGWAWEPVPELDYVDTLVYEKLRRVRSLPSELCTDAEFLRRVSLDLTGLPPTSREVRTFLLDARDTRVKRAELVERLIGSAEFVDYWTNKWCDLLQVNTKFLGGEGAERFRRWIQAQVASNAPYDEFVAALLNGSGSTYANPPAAYYKVLRKPDEAMENTTQLFLGVRFNCNKCHDHPFERWTQDQHWQTAAFFARVQRTNAEGAELMPSAGGNQPEDELPAFEEMISDAAEGEVKDPGTGAVVPPVLPYELPGGERAGGETRRAQLTAWLVAPENPYFARSYVNRLWSYFLGIGLIEPVDDVRAGNPPTNPALLERLTAEFVASGFDVRALMRTICGSRTYQHSIETNRWNADDDVNFAHALARRLPAEVLYDALHRAAGAATRLPGVVRGSRALDLVDTNVEVKDGFLGLFGRPPRQSACECERSSGMSLGQALNLVNGPTVADAIRDAENRIADLVSVERDAERLVEELYLSFLCRFPTPGETRDLAPAFDPTDPANRAALAPADERELAQALAAWQAGIRVPGWRTADPGNAESAAGLALEVQEDGSYRVLGEGGDKDTYTVFLYSREPRLTGIRLEVLPDPGLPASGPGRAENGNFVLGELTVRAVPLDDPRAARPLKLANASADFAQEGWPVAAAIDGDLQTGWAVMPAFGRPHVAVFELAEDVGGPAGTVLLVTLRQEYGQKHTIGRFRVSVTASARPVRHHGLPEPLAQALATPEAERTEEQARAIYAHFIDTHPELADRIRLGAAQDLAWALANSPAFLFNR